MTYKVKKNISSGNNISFDGDRAIKSIPTIGFNPGTNSITEFLEACFYAFVNATISINSGTSYFEKGTSQNIPLSGAITANDETTFSNARIERSTSGTITLTAAAGSYSKTDHAINADVDYIAKVDVAGNGNAHAINSGTKSIKFVFPFLTGMDASVLNGSTIYAALTKQILPKANKLVNFNDSNKYIYFAYPASYGDLTSIKDPNNFEVLGSFTKSVVTVSGLAGGLSTSYNIYVTNTLTSVPNQNFNFIF